MSPFAEVPSLALVSGATALLALGALGWIFIGYPAAAVARARLWPRPYPRGADAIPRQRLPRVAILIAACNEAERLPGKLQSLQELDYPPERLTFYVSDDGSTDQTSAVLESLAAAEPRLRWRRHEVNAGKPANLNALARWVEDDEEVELLVFCDARQPLDPLALRALVAPLDDPAIGGATGDLVLPPRANGELQGMGLYWRYETALRRAEAACGSVIGATGALYVVRRHLFTPFEPGLVLDDMLGPLRVALMGHRFVFADGALAYDVHSEGLGRELQRKARTLGGIFQAMALEPRLLRPGSPVFGAFLFHKVGRLAFPWLMALMLAGSAGAAVMWPSGLVAWGWMGLVAAQLLFYLGALLSPRLPRGGGPLRVLRTLAMLMLAAGLGWWRWRTGQLGAAWKTREERAAP